MYVLCNSMNGHCLNILPRIGEKKFTINYIISILSSKLNINGFLYMDRYYTSIELFLLLKEKGIYATGIVKSNRKNLPNELIKNLNLKSNETKLFNYAKKIRFLIWKNKNPIYMLSIYYDGFITSKERIETKDLNYSKKIINIPYLITQYNKYMSGVDLMDQHISLYVSNHRTLKWYKKIINYLIEIAINNSCILYNMYLDLKEPKLKQLNPLDFRLCLLNIKDIEEKKCLRNTVKENANIIRDPLQPDIISAFGINKSKKNKLIVIILI